MVINPKQKIAEIIEDAFVDLYGKPSSQLYSSVDYGNGVRGDFACSIALKEAARLKQPPIILAQAIAKHLAGCDEVENAAAIEPGFVNIKLKAEIWQGWLEQLSDKIFVVNKKQPESVSLEFVSANPTGPLVLANAWQAYFGDILARIYQNQGYKVDREYYFNDTGGQILNLGKSIQAVCGEKFDRDTVDNLYKGDYISDLAKQISEQYGSEEKVRAADAYDIGTKTATILFDVIKAGLLRLGVKFDRFFSETELDTNKILTLLASKNAISEYDGAIWLKKEVSGTDTDQVLVRSAQKGDTYFLKDIAYQLSRLADRKYTRAITIVGPDHHGQAQRLVNTLKFLGYDNFSMQSTQTVRLISEGREVKMSKRAGNFVLLDDFLDKVPTDVARFFFGSRDIISHLDIDLDVLTATTMQNPLYYCMYGYARSCSILRKAEQENIKPSLKIKHQLSEQELNLIKKASQLSEVLLEVEKTHRVHNLFSLMIEFSTAFHEYYEKDRVLSAKEDIIASKLAFVEKIKLYYEIVFELAGIKLQASM